MKRWWLALFLLALTGCQLYLPSSVPSMKASAAVPVEQIQSGILVEVNRVRAKQGSPALSDDPTMTRVAQLYSAELATRGKLDHTSKTPGRETVGQRMKHGNVTFSIVGENLVKLRVPPTEVVGRSLELWRGSRGHNKNLLDGRYRRSGVGATLGADGFWYIVQVFAA